jgi:drug/metabolite transporter (DMT)-like permease
MLALTFIWGLNAVSIKALTLGMAPIMGAALRGAIALALLTGYGWWRGESFRYSPRLALQGSLAGLIFAVEGVLLYRGATYTTGGHVAIFINTAQFFVAIGAHYLLPGDRLNIFKVAGLVLAFGGVVLLFSQKMGGPQAGYWRGDLLVMGAALMWASSTLYIKGVLGHRMSALRLMWIRILVSTVLLFAVSLLVESAPLARMDRAALVSVLFQGTVVVFFSYMMWVRLLQRYPASGLQAFTFLVPVWGVLMGGLLLGEAFTLRMAGGIALVATGLILLNQRPRTAPAAPAAPAADTAPSASAAHSAPEGKS